ncbi:hypothetical protein [Pseudomonas avellanae]|uniref:hypothetical protein n=1 Tax=Pseudomonas avellanae TaxID=46257 RepID=UPI00201B6CD9|nr:hypothetical protein [Pseudomonas avellanae]UQW71787.1 hypothetical protein L2Y00_28625 [Pseudomonas avellanae]
MKQMTFADAEYAGKRKQTRRERFLIEMVRIPRHLDTQPTIIWTLIPSSLGHLPHVHLDRQSERSDAGLHC